MKKLIAILSTITMITSLSLNVGAIWIPDYDINNAEYIKIVDSLGDHVYREQELLDYFNETYNNSMIQMGIEDFEPSPYKHIYGKSILSFTIEEGNDKYRTFNKGNMLIYEKNISGVGIGNDDRAYANNDEIMEKYTVEEINEFLKNEGLKSHIEEMELKTPHSNKSTSYQMCYEDDSPENMTDTFLAMNKKYGAIAQVICLATSSETYENEEVSGDANGDNSLSVQDCSFIAQALANRKGDTLPESADYNKDEKKNVIDAMEIAKDLARDKNK